MGLVVHVYMCVCVHIISTVVSVLCLHFCVVSILCFVSQLSSGKGK